MQLRQLLIWKSFTKDLLQQPDIREFLGNACMHIYWASPPAKCILTSYYLLSRNPSRTTASKILAHCTIPINYLQFQESMPNTSPFKIPCTTQGFHYPTPQLFYCKRYYFCIGLEGLDQYSAEGEKEFLNPYKHQYQVINRHNDQIF